MRHSYFLSDLSYVYMIFLAGISVQKLILCPVYRTERAKVISVPRDHTSVCLACPQVDVNSTSEMSACLETLEPFPVSLSVSFPLEVFKDMKTTLCGINLEEDFE